MVIPFIKLFDKYRENNFFGVLLFLGIMIYFAAIVICFIAIPTIIYDFIVGKNINEIYSIVLEEAELIGGFLLGLSVLFSPFFFIHLSAESALKNKKGNAFKVLEFIYGTFLFFLGCMGLYIVFQGSVYLYKEDLILFLIFIGAAIFSIYYWYKKKHLL